MVAELIPQLEAAISTCDSLIRNPRLTEFLALLLQLGNYLNAVSTILILLFLTSSFKTYNQEPPYLGSLVFCALFTGSSSPKPCTLAKVEQSPSNIRSI